MRYFVELILLLVIGAGIYIILDRNSAALDALANIKTTFIFIILLTNMVFIFVFAYYQNQILTIFGLHQTPVEWIGLSFIAAFYNLFLPAKGGSALRSTYLKKHYAFPYKNFVGYLIKQSVYMLIVISFVTGILLILSYSHKQHDCILILVCSSFLLSASIYFSEKKITNWLAARKKISGQLVIPEKRFWDLAIIIIILVILKGAAFYFAFSAINYPLSYTLALLIASLVMLSNLINILPGNIGIRELLIGGVLQIFGYDLSFVILAALVDRAAALVATTSGAVIYKYLLLRENTHNA